MGRLTRVVWTALVPIVWTACSASGQDLETFLSTTGFHGNEDVLPFWLRTNRYGLIPREGSGVLAVAGVRGSRSLSEGLNLDWKVTLVGNTESNEMRGEESLYFHELFARLEFGHFRLDAGWQEQVFGIIDTTLSAGSMQWSRNARPIPKVFVSTNGFLQLPLAGNWLKWAGYWGHGWMNGPRVVDNALLHEKYLYVQIRPPKSPFYAFAGLIHMVTWAGLHPERGQLPSGWDAYWKVVTSGRSGNSSDPSETLGNTVAIYDFALGLQLSDMRVLGYREFYLEDRSAAGFESPWDGLWGLSIRRLSRGSLVDGILYEHVHTVKQGAKAEDGEVNGFDSYYNNSTAYYSGWTTRFQTVGNPLLFGDGVRPGVQNNIVVGHHLGVDGTLAPTLTLRYRALMTYSRNYGAFRVCSTSQCLGPRVDEVTDRIDQWSFLLRLDTLISPERGISLALDLAADLGKVYARSAGFLVGLGWRLSR